MLDSLCYFQKICNFFEMKIFVNKFEKMMNFKVNYLYFLNIKNMKFEIKGWFDVLLLFVLFCFFRKSCILYCKVIKGGG